MHTAAGMNQAKMAIELLNESSSSVAEGDLISISQYCIAQMGLHPDCDLSITVVDEDEMSALHLQWMELEGPTDVLSFPMDELTPNTAEPGLIGDIVLCPTFADQERVKQTEPLSLEDELCLLTVHGILHCIGFDHREPEEEAAMFALQKRILAEWKARS